MRRLATVLLAVLAIALTGACRVDVSVGVDADDDGGGQVQVTARLDGAAVSQLGGEDPADRLKLDDLRDAGWRIKGPTAKDDGGLEIVATHDFANAEEAKARLEDVGALSGFDLEQRRTFFTTTTKLKGAVDLSEGLGAFTDADLEQLLGATPDTPLGLRVEAIEKRFGAPIDQLLGLQLAVHLPGKLDADDTNATTAAGGTAVWSPALGERVSVEASSRRWNVRNLVLLSVAVLAGLVLLGLTVTRSNVTLGNHGAAGTDEGGADGPPARGSEGPPARGSEGPPARGSRRP